MIDLIAALVAAQAGQVVDTRFENGLIYAQVETESGATLTVYTDTGGGMFLFRDAAQAAGLAETGDEAASWPLAAPDHVTVIMDEDAPLPLMDRQDPPGCAEAQGMSMGEQDGMFGARWFAGRAWRFDYAAQTLDIIGSGPVPQAGEAGVFPLHFQKPESVEPENRTHFPRVTAEIAGEPVDLLFDTGAQGCHRLPEEDGPVLWRAASFVSASLAERWLAANPDWRVMEGGDGLFAPTDMIEADNVRLGGVDLGPVWFVVRPDANFSEYMSQWMDAPVAGALGGNALSGRQVILDYPAEWGAVSP
jgi:hypothetical protein